MFDGGLDEVRVEVGFGFQPLVNRVAPVPLGGFQVVWLFRRVGPAILDSFVFAPVVLFGGVVESPRCLIGDSRWNRCRPVRLHHVPVSER